jgi:hypothetical protein
VRAFWIVVATRVAFWAAVLVALLWAPLHAGFPAAKAYGARTDFVFGAFYQWDATWFLRIAQHGYDTKQSASFFPLYPLLTRAVGFVLRSDLVAGVAISLVAAGFAGVAVMRIARRYAGDRVAHDSVIFLALYPISFVFTAAYSDGLFLALAAWAFLFALELRTPGAAVLAALAVLTRPTGLALLAGRPECAVAASAEPVVATARCARGLLRLPELPLRRRLRVRPFGRIVLAAPRSHSRPARRRLGRAEIRRAGRRTARSASACR